MEKSFSGEHTEFIIQEIIGLRAEEDQDQILFKGDQDQNEKSKHHHEVISLPSFQGLSKISVLVCGASFRAEQKVPFPPELTPLFISPRGPRGPRGPCASCRERHRLQTRLLIGRIGSCHITLLGDPYVRPLSGPFLLCTSSWLEYPRFQVGPQ